MSENETHEMVVREAALPAQKSVDDVVQEINKVQELMKRVMKKDVDYGVIPGTEKKDAQGNDISKPSLYQPGAELLGKLFNYRCEYEITWNWLTEPPGEHLAIFAKCKLYHIYTGRPMGEGVGSCSTMESKYRWRKAERKCPKCGAEAIIKGKEEYGGGWVCYKKKTGCGAKFEDKDPDIIMQVRGEIENPNISDVHNTVVKMAAKRAKVNAIITATAASSLFTQDLEDNLPNGDSTQKQEEHGGGGEKKKKTSGNTFEEATQPQILKIKATTRELANVAGRDAKDYLQGIYNELDLVGVHSTKDLSKKDASRIISHLEKLVELTGKGMTP